MRRWGAREWGRGREVRGEGGERECKERGEGYDAGGEKGGVMEGDGKREGSGERWDAEGGRYEGGSAGE